MKNTFKQARSTAMAAAIAVLVLPAVHASAANYAPWLTQIGITDSIMSAGNWGKNQMLAVVDTGIVASNLAFASGQVSSASSACAAVSFKCPNGFVDDNGHGTAVAAIAAGNRLAPFATSFGGYSTSAGSIMSLAPDANIIAQKVLSAKGTGFSTDAANGIKKAADAGASVINLSLTFGNTSDVIQAINYAASKGAFVVWAGGNDGKMLLNGTATNGLTQAGVNHLVLVGSVNSKNVLSSFSNTPGTGSLVDTSGNKYTDISRWAMAPGEAIVAPHIAASPTALAYWSGTSMATPLVSGSLLLLESAWPILKTNGTAANLLLATTTDLGAKGADATYGQGLVNLTTAFQPYGTLSVTQTNGKSVAVDSLTGAMITSTALGGLNFMQSKLANYAAFDGYQRNFSVNLSGLIKSPTVGVAVNALPTNVNAGPTVVKFSDGAELAYFRQVPTTPSMNMLGVFGRDPEAMQDKPTVYTMLTDHAGSTTALGYGFPLQYAYGRAMFGKENMAQLSSELGVMSLAGMAQGGGLFAYGTNLSKQTRLAFSWSSTAVTPVHNPLDTNPAWASPDASNLNVGLTHRISQTITAGLSVGLLNEKHGLLGSTYDAGSVLTLGDTNKSYIVGMSAGFDLNERNSLLIETGVVTTAGNTGSGLLAGTSELKSRSIGIAFLGKNLLQNEDRLTVSAKQPLRVQFGQIGVMMASTDEFGIAHYNTQWVDINPSGHEVDYKLAYEMPFGRLQALSFQAGYWKDAYNISGINNVSVGLVWSRKF